ncbi:putative Cellulose 1,4-beta-cellobiosidase [Hyella patelloides LEGE 07179]|uniref:Putative Cellulose 1,4-beta-cellobiosidase n=1 Tax=Hyella patelloides LEGE 07179 TaxID=945734 RepID=A0A563W2J9_9CYAN|nr:glycoside hydrolase family 9 protein [Hyella patelloides]VEP17865.1 putative Cellulose 1,4-beta-cellobiosidase [Hyella patelloides LEGE 07179]
MFLTTQMSLLLNTFKKSRYIALSLIIPGCSLLNGSYQRNISENIPTISNSLGGNLGRLETTRYLETENPDGALVEASPYIMVDQFGYRPQDNKVAVIVDPQQGFNAADSYTPGKVIEVRKWSDNTTVHVGAPKSWKNGEIQASSGDRGWWFDFSTVEEPGHYYIYDSETGQRSHPFLIDPDVYYPVLKAAVRMFYYNRSNFPKEEPYADPRWTDEASFIGPNQDTEARFVDDKNNEELARDVSGGWWDAGDSNKYVTFTSSVIHQLLDAYKRNPDAFTDDFNLPESGNGLPDIIDEVKYEIDWIKKMQQDDGGVLIKVGTIDYSGSTPKSRDRRPRYYVGACSSSTIIAAGHFARVASVYNQFAPLQTEIPELTERAKKAWDWYQNNPKRDDCDTQEVKSGDADRNLEEQSGDAVVAAIYLFALTGETVYNDYVKDHYQEARPFQKGDSFSIYSAHQGDALMFYTTLANSHPEVKQAIIERKTNEAQQDREFYGFQPEQDLYRSYLRDRAYHWGSNFVRANRGSSNYDVVVYNLLPNREQTYTDAALNTLNYFHGVNPLGMTYLSNMYDYGAENSANEIFHEWFVDKSPWDNALTSPNGPPPGYLVGGPNSDYTGNYPPLQNQPIQKMYADWNGTTLEDKSWEISEPAIYYQSAYIKLLAHFVGNSQSQQ